MTVTNHNVEPDLFTGVYSDGSRAHAHFTNIEHAKTIYRDRNAPSYQRVDAGQFLLAQGFIGLDGKFILDQGRLPA